MENSTWFEVPVFQGGMGVGVSLGGLAGAVAACGGAGTISAAQIGFQEPDFASSPLEANLRAMGKEVDRARQTAGGRGAVGMNIMVAMQHYGAYVKEAVRQKVDFIVSGAGLPMDLPELAAGSEVKKIPVVSSLKAARVICRRWWSRYRALPDAVVVEGPLAGGHLGFDKETARAAAEEEACSRGTKDPADPAVKKSFLSRKFDEEIRGIIEFLRDWGREHERYIPVITAGGLRTHEDMEHQRRLGADGIQVASRFVTTRECDADIRFKQAYVDCKKEDIVIVKSPVGMPGRAIRNSFIEKTCSGRIPPKRCFQCLKTCDPKTTPYCITQALINAVKGNLEDGLIFCGANTWQEDRIGTVKEVMDDLMGKSRTQN